MPKWIIILSWITLLPGAAVADAYKWVDEQGVHYSDRGRPGAEVIHLPAASSAKAGASAPTATRQPESGARQTAVPASSYTIFAISQPASGATVRSNEGKVQVVLDLEPDLAPTHRFRFYMDGKALEGDFSSRVVVFSNVERGEHSLRVEIVDIGTGRVIQARSSRFYLRRAAESRGDQTGVGSQPGDKGFTPSYPPVGEGRFEPLPQGDYRPTYTPQYTPTPKP